MKFNFNECIKSGVEQAMKECELTIGMTLKEAVEKQVPKKPKETDAYPHRLCCPVCYFTLCFNKENIDGIKQMQMYNHCPDCGQALDWSESK